MKKCTIISGMRSNNIVLQYVYIGEVGEIDYFLNYKPTCDELTKLIMTNSDNDSPNLEKAYQRKG